MPTMRIPGAETTLEAEYRSLCRGIGRCVPREVAFHAEAYAPEAVAAAREMWRVRMRSEYDSAPVFAALALDLTLANATLDAQAVVLRMAADELRHAEICGEAVRALGGDGACETSGQILRHPSHPGCGPEERALRNVIVTSCLVEVATCAHLVAQLDRIADPYLRERTRLLLADEALHASFGFEYLAAWAPWLETHPDVRGSIERYLRSAFAFLERERSGLGAPAKELSADEIALGIPDVKQLPDVFFQTVEGAILPGLERFGLDATSAWRSRSRDAGA